ncbi:MAG TPA: N-acetyltransferase [Phycisphaerales bacterium]|nr:N-acetyltransferase [Phycisphaerales bacterium]HRQ74687.1 N-acetyltransferase [Phycisphaerales bacterium]
MNQITIETVAHLERATAAGIHAVQMAAYAQEALLLGVQDFPPLRVTVRDIQSSQEQLTVALHRQTIIGAIGVEPPSIAHWSGQKLDTFHISSLAVLPEYQRQGIGRRLVQAIIAAHGAQRITVSTDARNAPALVLYRRLDFIECQRRTVIAGDDAYDLILLRRKPC